MPPHGSNRGQYRNPQVDALLSQGATSTDLQQRKAIYLQTERLLANDEPTLVLWSLDSIVVHRKRLHGVEPSPSGSFAWLRTSTLQ